MKWIPLILLSLSLVYLKISTPNVLLVKSQKKNANVRMENNVSRFLHYIKQLETSGGTNLDHKPIKSGIHAGDVAQGEYGVMPNTMEELDNRYPAAFSPKSTSEDYAKKLAEKVLTRANGDETLAAGLWNMGHNARKDRFDEIRDTDYAQKYDKLRQEIPYALDENPYQQEYQDNKQDFLKIRKILQK